jgi:hypothetical protein
MAKRMVSVPFLHQMHNLDTYDTGYQSGCHRFRIVIFDKFERRTSCFSKGSTFNVQRSTYYTFTFDKDSFQNQFPAFHSRSD